MSQFPQILAGMNPAASLLQSLASFFAYKPADQSVTSSVALVNDTALALPVAANATYFMVLYLDYEGASGAGLGIRWGWTFPAGLTMRHGQLGNSGSALNGAVGGTNTQATVGTALSNGAAVLQSLILIGTVAVSSTPGTLQLQWAQDTSSATSTIVHAGSVLGMWRIS